MSSKRIGLLHGAILNSGDFLIFNRGKNLLNKFLDSKYELIEIKRWESFDDKLDVLIILGGPIISRTMHPQSINIKNYLKKNKIPVICLGIGISGENFKDVKGYFDEESIEFWKDVYKSSYLFSVRDRDSLILLRNYGLDVKLTGCPALYNLNFIQKQKFTDLNASNHRLAVTIPQIDINYNPIKLLVNIKNFWLIIFFIYYLKSKLDTNTKFLLILQHGLSIPLILIDKFAIFMGFKTLDASGKGLDEFKDIAESSFHIGTRLHSHILFLSSGKPSYLLNVDNRTRAFSYNFEMEIQNFSFIGIIKTSNMISKELHCFHKLKDRVNISNKKILDLYKDMESFLIQIDEFLEKND